MIKITEQTFDKERALYALQDAEVIKCVFSGEADGESPLKETRGLNVTECEFGLRYALWHSRFTSVTDSKFLDTCRAPLWYCSDVKIAGCTFSGVKALRECDRVSVGFTNALSEEFGWKCRGLDMFKTKIRSDYAFLDSSDLKADNISLTGKYSFQYVENAEILNSNFNTKDAFWHSRNVTVKDSTIKGEYIGWYSENLKLVNCLITGTQPFCYCRGLVLENCTLVDCDLAFENSDVTATVNGRIDSVKNPLSGKITADSFGEIIIDTEAARNGTCRITARSAVRPEEIRRVPEMMMVYAGPGYFANSRGIEWGRVSNEPRRPDNGDPSGKAENDSSGIPAENGRDPSNAPGGSPDADSPVYTMQAVYAGPQFFQGLSASADGFAAKAGEPGTSCVRCGCANGPGSKFCRECGTRLGADSSPEAGSRKFCRVCGAALSPDSQFCSECGSLISNSEKTNH